MASVAVVLAVLAVVLIVGARHDQHRAAASGPTRLVFRAQPTVSVPHVTAAALREEVAVLKARLNETGIAGGGSVMIGNRDAIVVTLPAGIDATAASRALISRPTVEIYDWEANVLTPSGQPAAAELLARNPRAITLSQGRTDGPGVAGAGAMRLYAAVRLAARQPAMVSNDSSTSDASLYLFADARTARCPERVPCYLAGPTSTRSALQPPRHGAHTQTIVVHRGTVILQAADQPVAMRSPRALFYVLHDRMALSIGQIRSITVSSDPDGGQDVDANLTTAGKHAFARLTKTVSHRGEQVSLGKTLRYQHLAFAFDGHLISLPQLNFTEFPDGVVFTSTNRPIQIAANLPVQAAHTLAAQLQLGSSPLRLTRVSPPR